MEPAPASLQVKLLSSTAKAPTRSSAFAAGYDVYASRETVVPAWGKVLVETDLSVAVPMGTYGRVAPRSGLASKHSIDVGAGVIDADYRGPVKVLLFNLSSVDFGVSAGDRVAQLVLERVSFAPWLFRRPSSLLIMARSTHPTSLSWSNLTRRYAEQGASAPLAASPALLYLLAMTRQGPHKGSICPNVVDNLTFPRRFDVLDRYDGRLEAAWIMSKRSQYASTSRSRTPSRNLSRATLS